MLKNFLISIVTLITLDSAAATPTCLQLLTRTLNIPIYDQSRMATARLWIQQMGQEETFADRLLRQPDFAHLIEQEKVNWQTATPSVKLNLAARFTLHWWDTLKNTSESQRDFALGFELSRLSPPQTNKLHRLDGNTLVTRLSAHNLERVMARLEEIYPVATHLKHNPEVLSEAYALAAELNFTFVRPHDDKNTVGHYPTLASDRDLQHLNLNFKSDFYSHLVDGSASVAFNLSAVHIDQSMFNLNGRSTQTALRLDPQFAAQNGFVAPVFANAIELIQFFRMWDPEKTEELMRINRYSLPLAINTFQKFSQYLDPARIEDVFPKGNLFRSMAPLRESLHNYVFSVQDATDLLRRAFIHFIVWRHLEDPQGGLRDLQYEWKLAGGTQNIFSKQFRQWLGLPHLAVRIPIAVPPNLFSILRIESLPYKPFRDLYLFNQSPWDSRRLDKSLMP